MVPIPYEEAIQDASEMTIFDPDKREYSGMWSDIRIDRDTLPEGMNAYDIREDDDEDMWLAAIEKDIVYVNYAGTFLTRENLPLPTDTLGCTRAAFGENNGWDYSFS